ncbi:hypothetical protein P8936_14665 [Edaphobacter paludis]|uniref:Uncharacterized protein n=1 Tax=Edaphobacter paludis TaxID=3035702 RepID=A0AAU7D5T2_9BACT
MTANEIETSRANGCIKPHSRGCVAQQTTTSWPGFEKPFQDRRDLMQGSDGIVAEEMKCEGNLQNDWQMRLN